MAPAPDPLGLVGFVVDEKYRVESVVGAGGFATVYRAHHLIWNQPVALKCFSALSGVPRETRDELVAAFVREGQLMSSLSSRSAAIVQARDVGTLVTPAGTNVPYMVLEWLEGTPLDRALAAERDAGAPLRALGEAIALLAPVAAALELAHQLGVAHRDIKPANLFVIGDSRGAPFVKVLDFGIAKVMSEHARLQTSLAETGASISAFTPNYGAPEQFSRTHGATGPWTDVFALALILVEVLGGVRALDGDDLLQLALASRDPLARPTPRVLGLDVPDAVELVFRKALAVAPADRYKTAGAFWGELERAALEADRPPPSIPLPDAATRLAARSSSPDAPPIDVGAATRPTSAVASTPTAPPTASSGRGVALGLVAVVATAGVALAWRRSGEGPASVAPSMSASSAPSVVVPAPTVASSAPACPDDMVLVPAGTFFMGSDDANFPRWSPAHKVRITKPFCFDRREVTAAAYKACVDVGECQRADLAPTFPAVGITPAQNEANQAAFGELCNLGPDNTIKPGRESHPVNCVAWDRADTFCRSYGKRLPTEAEWEYAARGSDGRKYPWGDEPGGDGQHMNACGSEFWAWQAAHRIVDPSAKAYDLDDGHVGTAPVGSFPKGRTKLGLDDMIGNVWEWTQDGYADYTPDEQRDPSGAASSENKVMRGGGFNSGNLVFVNPAFRYYFPAKSSSHVLGFRCARALDEPASGGPPKP